MDYVKNKESVYNHAFVNHTPTELQNLISKLETRTHQDIPISMLPVRLETRFMKDVEKNLLEEAIDKNVFEVFMLAEETSTLGAKFAIQTNFNKPTQVLAVQKLASNVASILQKVAALNKVKGVEKKALSSLIMTCQKEILSSVESIANKCSSEDDQLHILEEILPTIESGFQRILTTIGSKNIDTVWVNEISAHIREFVIQNRLPNSIENLINEGAPTEGLDAYFGQLVNLTNSLSQLTIITAMDKLYLLEQFEVINGHAETIYNALSNEDESLNYKRLGFIHYSNFQDVWKLRLDSTLNRRNYLTKVPYSDLLSEEEKNYFRDRELKFEGLDDILQRIDVSIEGFLENNFGLREEEELIAINNAIHELEGFLNGIEPAASEKEKRYAYSKIAVVDIQINNLLKYIGSLEERAEGILEAQKQIKNAAYGASFGWNNFIQGSLSPFNKISMTYFVNELWIRVYPDDIHIINHEKQLTPKEILAGKAYWDAWWAACGDPSLQLEAWKNLVLIYGEERAAWIIKSMTPTNLSNAIISNIYAANAQLVSLNTLTQQLTSISNSSAISSYLGTYSTQIASIQSKVSGLRGVLNTQAEIYLGNVNKLKNNFTVFSNSIQKPGNLAEPLNAISSSINSLSNSLQGMTIYTSWSQLYSQTPVYPVLTPREEGTFDASHTKVLPDRFLFAAINEEESHQNTANANSITSLLTTTNKFKHIKIGKEIPSKVFTGPKVGAPDFDIKRDLLTDEIDFDPDIEWMVNYVTAVKEGLACSIIIDNDDWDNGFKKLIVLGVQLGEKETSTPTGGFDKFLREKCKGLLEELFENHHYTNPGMGIIKFGTPTNNTDDSDSGFNKPDPYYLNSFAVEVGPPLFSNSTNKLTKKDGQWISEAFGINANIFHHIDGAGGTQISNAININRALWNGTIGNYLEEYMTRLFPPNTIKNVKKYFTDYVIARGMVPPIRVGNQPYGILATTSFTRWSRKNKFDWSTLPNLPNINAIDFAYNLEDITPTIGPTNVDKFLEDRFYIKFHKLLETLNKVWLEIATNKVKTVQMTSGPQDFMEALGTDGIIAEIHNRFLVNATGYIPPLPSTTSIFDVIDNSNRDSFSFDSGSLIQIVKHFDDLFKDTTQHSSSNPKQQGSVFDFLPSNDNFIISGLDDIINCLRAFNIKPMENEFILKGSTSDEILSEIDSLVPINGTNINYIEWLLNNSLSQVWNNNQFGIMPSRSLLYLLMRQSLLLTYRKTAWDTLVKTNVFDKDNASIIGSVEALAIHLTQTTPREFLTKWHLLFKSINTLTAATSKVKDSFQLFDTGTIPSWSNKKLGEYLINPNPPDTALNNNIDFADINSLRESFNLLKKVPSAELDRLMKEHISLCSYRLDAWNYGMVHNKLWEKRTEANSKTGIYIGAFGWLLDVKPKVTPMTAFPSTNTNDDLIPDQLQYPSGSIFFDSTNLGIIQTPSIAHALTAAVLRSGYVSETNATSDKFSINLTSERVNKALFLLDGIRNGQTLGALLGYQFEKGLMDKYNTISGLNTYLQALRKKFPLNDVALINANQGPSNSNQNNRVNTVVNGLILLESFRTYLSSEINENPKSSMYEIATNINPTLYNSWLISVFGSAVSTSISACILKELDGLANTTDAIADIALTEGVFQITQSNYPRSSAIMEAVSTGKVIPEIEVTNNPKSGLNLTHNLAVAISTAGIGTRPLGLLEPKLNGWVDMLLQGFNTTTPYLNHICEVSFDIGTSSIPNVVSDTITISDLGLDPIELLYLVNDTGFTEELNKRIRYLTRINHTLSSTIVININYDVVGVANFSQLRVMLNSVRTLVQNARQLTPDDFNTGFSTDVSTSLPKFNFTDIDNRLIAFLQNFKTIHTNIKNAISSFPVYVANTNTIVYDQLFISSINTILQNASAMVLHSYYPFYFEEDPLNESLKKDIGEGLLNQLQTMDKIFEDKKMNLVQEELIDLMYFDSNSSFSANLLFPFLATSAPTITQDVKLDKYNKVVEFLVGNGFKIMPKFYLEYYSGLEAIIKDQINVSLDSNIGLLRNLNNLLEADEEMNDWIYSIARIEPNVENFETVKFLTNDTSFNSIRPIQLPINTQQITNSIYDYWLGLEYPNPTSYVPEGDKTSTLVVNSDIITSTSVNGEYTGLVIHHWNEFIPNKEEITGMTFHYDQPSAKPPQNVLLMVHPGNPDASKITWSLEDILFGVLDTMDMSKIRLVEPDHFKHDGLNANTKKFELFKWVLPMVVGEVTPLNNEANNTHTYQGESDSLQQVSFDFNANNEKLPPAVANNSLNSIPIQGTFNIASINSNVMLSQPVQNFIGQQNIQTAIAATIQQLQNLL